jgi:hypothetical protein
MRPDWWALPRITKPYVVEKGIPRTIKLQQFLFLVILKVNEHQEVS